MMTMRFAGRWVLASAIAFALAGAAAASAQMCGNGNVDFPDETCDNGGICQGGANEGQACTTVQAGACPDGTCTPVDGDRDLEDRCPANCAINRECDPTGTADVKVRFARACLGDCDGDGKVELNELITGIAIGLGTGSVNACLNFDLDGDGVVGIDSLTAGVSNSINGCAPPEALGASRFFLRYPDSKVRVPGSGTDESVLDRITTPVVGALTPNDIDYALRILVQPDFGFMIDPDELFTVSFDVCGASELRPEDFRCTVFDAFSPEGADLTAQTSCFVELP
jgi:hypothetical protein